MIDIAAVAETGLGLGLGLVDLEDDCIWINEELVSDFLIGEIKCSLVAKPINIPWGLGLGLAEVAVSIAVGREEGYGKAAEVGGMHFTGKTVVVAPIIRDDSGVCCCCCSCLSSTRTGDTDFKKLKFKDVLVARRLLVLLDVKPSPQRLPTSTSPSTTPLASLLGAGLLVIFSLLVSGGSIAPSRDWPSSSSLAEDDNGDFGVICEGDDAIDPNIEAEVADEDADDEDDDDEDDEEDSFKDNETSVCDFMSRD